MKYFAFSLTILVFLVAPIFSHAACTTEEFICEVSGTQFCTTSEAACTGSSPGAEVIGPGTEPPGTGGSGSGSGQSTSGLINALQADTFEELVTDILDAVVQLGAIFLVLALVWVGFLFVEAQGSEDKIKKAREALFWSVAGGLILLGASAISLAIKGFVGAL